MPKVAIVVALEREVSGLIEKFDRVEREYDGRRFTFFERDEMVVVCGGIGLEAARRAAGAVIALYQPILLQSVGFAGALQSDMRVGDIFAPAVVVDARDGSRIEIEGGKGVLVTFMAVAGIQQKANLTRSYGAGAVDMEAAAVAAAARAHRIMFRAIKVISDESNFEMPEMALFLDAQGRFRTASFARFVVLRPWLWRRVVILASNSRKAGGILSQHLKLLSQTPTHVIEAKTP